MEEKYPNKRLSHAVRLATFLALGSPEIELAKLIQELWKNETQLAIANYAIIAPEPIAEVVVEVAANQIAQEIGGDFDFWVALLTRHQRNGKTLSLPQEASPAAPPQAPPVHPPAEPPHPHSDKKEPQPKSPAIPPKPDPKPVYAQEELEKDLKFIEDVRPYRERIHKLLDETGMSLRKFTQAHESGMSYSFMCEVMNTKPRSAQGRSVSKARLSQIDKWISAIEKTYHQPTTAPTKTSESFVAPTVIPTDHKSRVKLAANFVKKIERAFNLKELGEVLHLDDERKVYEVLREVAGVRRLSGAEFKYYAA